MKKEFVTYKQALALEKLGFDEPCLAGYNSKDRRDKVFTYPSAKDANTTEVARVYKPNSKDIVGAPLYQQVFRWFEEKYGLHGWTEPMGALKPDYYTWFIQSTKGIILDEYASPKFKIWAMSNHSTEEAKLDCLKKLIDIVNEKT